MTNVTLRTKKSSGQKTYLYLDYYPPYMDPVTRITKRQEYLGMFIYTTPKNTIQKQYNQQVMEVAEAIRSKRSIAVLNQEAGLFNRENGKLDFLKYYESKSKGKSVSWKVSLNHFKRFVKGQCRFGDLTVKLCQDYSDYLLNSAKNCNPLLKNKESRRISSPTAAKYYGYFRNIILSAYREGFIKDNLHAYIDNITPKSDFKREYLTEDEVRQLYSTPCKYTPLKMASMFSIFTGLRISDIVDLKWGDITVAPDGQPCIRKKMIKGSRNVMIFISEQALKFCGERRSDEKAVFYNFRRSMTQAPLQAWLKSAGIKKHITFHSFRHTNATLMLANGVDIYTVSAQLNHRNVKTTQIYSNLVDEKRRMASRAINIELDDCRDESLNV